MEISVLVPPHAKIVLISIPGTIHSGKYKLSRVLHENKIFFGITIYLKLNRHTFSISGVSEYTWHFSVMDIFLLQPIVVRDYFLWQGLRIENGAVESLNPCVQFTVLGIVGKNSDSMQELFAGYRISMGLPKQTSNLKKWWWVAGSLSNYIFTFHIFDIVVQKWYIYSLSCSLKYDLAQNQQSWFRTLQQICSKFKLVLLLVCEFSICSHDLVVVVGFPAERHIDTFTVKAYPPKNALT